MARARKTRRRRGDGKAAARQPRVRPRRAREEGVARGIWSGSISFGLLQIPVTLHPAEKRSGEIHLRMLDRHGLVPIKTQRVNPESGKVVPWEDVVKGYEYEPGQFVALDEEELKKANVQATQTIDIQDFVPAGDIDPTYFERPYYAVPGKRSAKAYALLREALKRKSAAAIGTFVLRTREHLCALLPMDDAILVETLRFGHELVSAKELPLEAGGTQSVKVSDREREMAERLVEEMMAKWQPEKYRDRFYDDVRKLIDQKVRTGRVRAAHVKPRGKAASNVVDLVALLQKSIRAGGKHGAREPRRQAA